MFSKIVMATAALAMMAGSAFAETYEVKMLNKGEAGSMGEGVLTGSHLPQWSWLRVTPFHR